MSHNQRLLPNALEHEVPQYLHFPNKPVHQKLFLLEFHMKNHKMLQNHPQKLCIMFLKSLVRLLYAHC